MKSQPLVWSAQESLCPSRVHFSFNTQNQALSGLAGLLQGSQSPNKVIVWQVDGSQQLLSKVEGCLLFFSRSATYNDYTFNQTCQDDPLNSCCWHPALHLHCCQYFITLLDIVATVNKCPVSTPHSHWQGLWALLPVECISSWQCQNEIGSYSPLLKWTETAPSHYSHCV